MPPDLFHRSAVPRLPDGRRLSSHHLRRLQAHTFPAHGDGDSRRLTEEVHELAEAGLGTVRKKSDPTNHRA